VYYVNNDKQARPTTPGPFVPTDCALHASVPSAAMGASQSAGSAEAKASYYDVLGVERTATHDE